MKEIKNKYKLNDKINTNIKTKNHFMSIAMTGGQHNNGNLLFLCVQFPLTAFVYLNYVFLIFFFKSII